MTKARNLTKSKTEDISKYYNGDSHLISIANDSFKCYDSKCDAELILCSYNDYNIPAPYFKTAFGEAHRKGCSNTVVHAEYSPGDITTQRYTGESAFNAIRRRYSDMPNKSLVLYNKTTGTKNAIPSKNTENNRAKSKNKVGPILYDGTHEIIKETTYMASLSDFKLNEEGGYLNLSNFGLGVTEDSLQKIKSCGPRGTIFFYSKYVNKSGGWGYAKKPNILVIKDGSIIHEQSWRDFNQEWKPGDNEDDFDIDKFLRSL